MPKFKENPSPLKYGKKSSSFKMKNPIKQMGMMGAAMGANPGTGMMGGGVGGLAGGAFGVLTPGMERSKIYHGVRPTSRGRKR